MKYEHIIAAVCGVPWAIDPAKLAEIMGVLAHRAAGHEFTPEEISARIGSRADGVTARGRGVGVLPIRGTIAHRMGSMDEASGAVSSERLGAMLAQMTADESIGTILLDIDSPGGTVTGVSELADQIYAARAQGTRVVSLVNGLAASAAYWLASQANEIVSIPSGLAGSIGVFTAHQDLSAALQQQGIAVTLLSAGKHKVDGNPFEPLSDEHRAHVQGQVDAAYAQFVKDVARGRGVSVSDVRGGFGQGRVLMAKDAKAAGLIDKIATVDETVSRLVGSRGGVVAEAAPSLVSAARRLEWF